MTRPTYSALSHGLEGWDTVANANKAILEGPIPVKEYTFAEALPSASAYDRCVVAKEDPSGIWSLYMSDGTSWHRLKRLADVTETLPIIWASGVASVPSGWTLSGDTVGLVMATSDRLFLQWALPVDIDRAVSPSLQIDYSTQDAEASKNTSWDLNLTAMTAGGATTTTGQIQVVDQALPGSADVNDTITFVVTAGTYLGAGVTMLNARLTRVAATADPTADPLVYIARVTYTPEL